MSSLTETTQATLRVQRLRRLGVRRMTRAHLTLARRAAAVELAQAGLQRITAGLSRALQVDVSASARLLDASWDAQRVLGGASIYGLLDFTALGSSAVLEMERGFLTAALALLSGGELPAPSPVTTLTRIEEAALGYLLLVGLDALRAEGPLEQRLAPRLHGVSADALEAREHLDLGLHVLLEVALSVGSLRGTVRCALSAEALQVFAVQCPETPRSAPQPEWLAAELPARCCLEAAPLPSEQVDRLEIGDVVLLSGLRLTAGSLHGGCRLPTLGFELHGELVPEGFRLARAVPAVLPPEKTMVPAASVQTPLLPVNVEVELARLQLPLGELVSLQPGMVLPLHISASEPVLLRIGERRVARAELVDIEGEVGARILALLP